MSPATTTAAAPSLSNLPVYCTVLSQSLSPDGRWLAVGEERGRMEVFRVEDLVERKGSGQENARPRRRLDVGKPVLAMQNTERDLVIGEGGKRMMLLG